MSRFGDPETNCLLLAAALLFGACGATPVSHSAATRLASEEPGTAIVQVEPGLAVWQIPAPLDAWPVNARRSALAVAPDGVTRRSYRQDSGDSTTSWRLEVDYADGSFRSVVTNDGGAVLERSHTIDVADADGSVPERVATDGEGAELTRFEAVFNQDAWPYYRATFAYQNALPLVVTYDRYGDRKRIVTRRPAILEVQRETIK